LGSKVTQGLLTTWASFSSGIDLNGWIYMHHWGSVAENGVSAFLDSPKNREYVHMSKTGHSKI
jgi:hypothetical protein